MQKNYTLYARIILASIIGLFIITAAITFRFVSAYQKAQTSQQELVNERLSDQEKAIQEIALAIDVLVANNEDVAAKLQEEKERRIESDAVAQAASAQLTQLQKEVEENNPDILEVVAAWSPRVGKIRCQYDGVKTSGSVTLFSNIAGSVGIVTNEHVILEDNKLPEDCSITFQGSSTEYKVDIDAIDFENDGKDFVKAKITNADSSLLARLNSYSYCTATPEIGETIITLGYPNIGSKEGITVTEGIISGIDKDYYITSAKVEEGNSGGASVLASKRCYLGTPTFVIGGKAEAFARILHQDVIF
ncbi:MAG: serine protease [Candidatus Paceibacterota bacterium]